ncbi:MAG TPA: acyltransferase [Acidimicrobiales bacterium]|nr:acyltransferase [Acidimicrobiales bacterium]
MLVTTPPPGPAAGANDQQTRAARRAPHLWQVDVVRLLTFSAVIAVHVLAFTQQPGNRGVAGAMMLLQFGRELFFALTGFVLVYSAWGRPFHVRPFWRKRILYVAVPYVAWSVVYYIYAVAGPAHMQPSVAGFAWDLLDGNAEYHLYFLLVTLQLYLVFPLVLRFVRRTADRAVPVLAGVTVLNLVWMAVLAYVPTPSAGMANWMFHHSYELLPTYAMYVLAGCYAAVHIDRVQDFVQRHRRRVLQAAAASAALALIFYAVQLPLMAPRTADQVVQPAMVFSCIAAVLVTYMVGTGWAEGPRRHQRTIEVLSDASFGIYLAHPLVLQFLLDYGGFGNDGQRLPAAAATVLGYLITGAGATLISLAVRRTPLSLALSGRPWRARAATSPAPQKALAPC